MINSCKILALALALGCGATSLQAAKGDSGVIPMPNAHESVNQHLSYPFRTVDPPAQTPAPKGYVPFHMEHYGRHGSRWLCTEGEYTIPVQLLGKALADGKLTPLGRKLYKHLKVMADSCPGRVGDLTTLGALEHQAIGRRMARNYPEIFNNDAHLDARSSVVMRCVISMLNEVKELQAAAPGMKVTTDATQAEMWRNVPGYTAEATRLRDSINTHVLPAYKARFANKGQYLDKVFTDVEYARANFDTNALAGMIIAVLGGDQNHIDREWMLEEVFTPEELVDQWHMMNAYWWIEAGVSPMSNRKAALQRAPTLRNMIESADTAMTSPRTSANLRFGHDGIVLPLAVMLELNEAGTEFESLDRLDGMLHDYRIIPMACNIQMVFYRPEGTTNPENVLVKVLLNETEAKLPLKPVSKGSPYYRWPEVRKYYMAKLDACNR